MTPASIGEESPQSIVAVCGPTIPGSVKRAGASDSAVPSSIIWSGPASTIGVKFAPESHGEPVKPADATLLLSLPTPSFNRNGGSTYEPATINSDRLAPLVRVVDALSRIQLMSC